MPQNKASQLIIKIYFQQNSNSINHDLSKKNFIHVSFELFVFPHEAVGAAKKLLIRSKNSKNLIWVTQIFSTFH